ncbi:hypothetical protein C7H19_08345 [Aphanothece hegewaldii CCALA 016]|uniref:Uncharacterized protein n=1 Tax=Aphanothece hegewaldii CCALA 016 TaxID=2107694 RepID=A0A2T1LZZ4_9CHRO|nr:hypothetical protein [Aphanothece hegewaldii]PSF37972.1 hypothetical protein C7H19_08345 [Aphanothece hegewaldii CCALA 016]
MKMLLREQFDQQTLLELFWTEPIKSIPEDGYCCYEAKDSTGTRLLFGIDTINKSIQIELKNLEHHFLSLTYELVDFLEIIDLKQGKFTITVAPKIAEIHTQIQIELRPYIKIKGYTLSQEG